MPGFKAKDYSGEKYGRWSVISFVRMDKKKHSSIWICRCECGTEKELAASSFSNGGTQSCGCLVREMMAAKQFKHGMAGTSTFNIWCAMRERCENQNSKSYHRYGARGIAVCDRWQSFENFLADMGERPAGMSLERQDNSLGYSRENCIWATAHAQARNKRNNIWICWDDHVVVLKDAAKYFGVSYKLAHGRIRRGWSVSDALTKAA